MIFCSPQITLLFFAQMTRRVGHIFKLSAAWPTFSYQHRKNDLENPLCSWKFHLKMRSLDLKYRYFIKFPKVYTILIEFGEKKQRFCQKMQSFDVNFFAEVCIKSRSLLLEFFRGLSENKKMQIFVVWVFCRVLSKKCRALMYEFLQRFVKNSRGLDGLSKIWPKCKTYWNLITLS